MVRGWMGRETKIEENIPHRWGIQTDFNLNWQRLEGRQRETEGMAGQEAAGQSGPFVNVYTYTYTCVFGSPFAPVKQFSGRKFLPSAARCTAAFTSEASKQGAEMDLRKRKIAAVRG